MNLALPDGVAYERGDDGYEAARRATVWNARLPDRFPDVIVQAHTEADVVAAFRFAAEHSHRVGVRSGGHSWAANHVRDGGVLLDVSRLDALAVDPATMTATGGPGRKGHEMCAALADQGLFFPAGHCKGVAVGGYLLQGGYGWNGRVLGPACQSVIGLDVVTADGEQVFADADHIQGNPSAEVEVRTAPDGTILGSPRLVKSSGVKAWDEAVLRAIEKTEVMPRDVDGRVPAPLLIELRPKR